MNVTHLFKPCGAPAPSPAERAFLAELRRMDGPLEIALQDYDHALQHDDVAAGVRAARRLIGIAGLLKAAADVIDRPPVIYAECPRCGRDPVTWYCPTCGWSR